MYRLRCLLRSFCAVRWSLLLLLFCRGSVFIELLMVPSGPDVVGGVLGHRNSMRPVVAIFRSRLLVRNLSLLLAFLPFAWVAAGGAEAGPAPAGTFSVVPIRP